MPSKELGDSLVDMYKANPKVNLELRQRLPSPARQQLSNSTQQLGNTDRFGISLELDHSSWNPAPWHPPDPVTSPSPVSHQRSLSPVSLLYQKRLAVSLLSHQRPEGGAVDMEDNISTGRCSSPWADSCEASRGSGSPDLKRHLVTTEDSFHQDQDKNISFLLKELDALRDINKKLQEQLVQKEKELQMREVEEELRVEQKQAQDWERPAAVLEEMLAAQKDRDQALMSRLLLANEERDEAVLRARRLQQATEWENLNLDKSELDVDELLQRIFDAESVQEVEQFGSVLVQRVHLAQQRRNDITAQEMNAIMEERDGSVTKCKRLEQDLIQEREQQATKEELLRLQRERDGALEDRCRLEVELQALRTNHSSQVLLTEGVPGGPLVPPQRAHLQQAMPPVSPPLYVQLQHLSKEKQNMEAELQRCQEAEREACDRVHRLERLVEVLRKKVGTGSLRAVI
ncbi:mirror-image polydactyly gene 1 protein isoform X2 [Anabas testudineus]|uniref:Mirror-image polydactyly 1 n=1 Tax=Anabas testudineus TaxID=64144 RepID=A0AAQ6IFT6_ANATE|nr:mirror-image polydactyly gene 1 protein isoform X2 [Anabas testudineus]